MKSFKLLIGLCALNLAAAAQNSYGVIIYPHANSWLSSGTVTAINPGFIMAGHEPAVTTFNFTLDRVGVGGVPAANPWNFQNGYNILISPNCAGPLMPSVVSNGISVIESATAGDYALAGTTGVSAYFATIASGGGVTAAMHYRFPFGASNITKPLITESSFYGGEFYIVGAYTTNNTTFMYMLRVNAAGAILASTTRSTPGLQLTPMAILESPYGPQDLTIVGFSNNAATAADGFFYQISNTLAGLPTVFNRYDNTVGANSNNGFSSLIVSNSTAGFQVGGWSVSPAGQPGNAWMMNLSAVGGINWSTIITGAINPISGKIYGVAERFSAFYATGYEYYGACQANAGLTVYKLDNLGVPFGTTYPGQNDEFVYNAGSGSAAWPGNITARDQSTGLSDQGIHMYGNLNNTGTGNHYFVEAYFNGVSGCEALAVIPNYDQTPPTVLLANDVTIAPLTACPLIAINRTPINPYKPVCGPAPSVPGGSLNKTTAIAELSNAELFDVYPNPVTGKATIKSNVKGEDVSYLLSNTVGETFLIPSASVQQTDSGAEINFGDLNLADGVYILTVKNGNETAVKKIMYQK